MAEYSANAVQTVAPGQSIVFTESVFPCNRGLVRHSQGSSTFLLKGAGPDNSCCRCCSSDAFGYFVDFGANIAVPTDETVGPISLAISVDGAIVPATTMIVTPAAVENYFNVGVAKMVPVYKGCCQTVTITNTSTIPILVQNANIVFSRPDLNVTR